MTLSPITTPIGSGRLSDLFDLNTTRETFRDLGLYHENETGPMVDKALDTAIRTFQLLNDDLKVDGIIKPAGETENRLFEIVTGQPHPKLRDVGLSKVEDDSEPKNARDFIIPERKPERKSRERQPLENKKESSRNLFEIEPVKKEKRDEQIVKLEKTARDTLKDFDDNNYTLSSKLFRHYLGKSGETLVIPHQDIEKSGIYKDAVETNNKRFEDSLTKGYVDGNKAQKSPLMNQILNLKDGQEVELKNLNVKNAGERWDRDVGRWETFLRGDGDHFRALGAAKMKSLGHFKARRDGDHIHIEGNIDHILDDIYDFNDDTIMDRVILSGFREMQDKSMAKTFKVHSRKPQKLKGALQLKNGKIIDSMFEWQDQPDR